jgi:hypothetical protein
LTPTHSWCGAAIGAVHAGDAYAERAAQSGYLRTNRSQPTTRNILLSKSASPQGQSPGIPNTSPASASIRCQWISRLGGALKFFDLTMVTPKTCWRQRVQLVTHIQSPLDTVIGVCQRCLSEHCDGYDNPFIRRVVFSP